MGRESLDVSGLVVAPGFIDLHAHGQDNRSNALQARDGVTTALDLEVGAYPVGKFIAQRARRAILNYGVSAGHMPARATVTLGVEIVHYPTRAVYTPWYMKVAERIYTRFVTVDIDAALGNPLSEAETNELVARIAEQLDAGGIGIGFGLDYVPGASDAEIRHLFELAADRGVPCFVHMKGVASPTDMSSIENVLGHVVATGASLHVLHVTSSGQERTPRYLELIQKARDAGNDVTVEAYPYTAGSTFIEMPFFEEGWRERLGIDYEDLQWAETGERLTAESFGTYRERGGQVIIHMTSADVIDAAIAHPLVMIASDGMPMLSGGEHPRGAGTFARILGRYTREFGTVALVEAIRKMTLMPAERLESFVPAMRNKDRIRVGADADITVFDPALVTDRATYEESHRASDGIDYVLVAGRLVVRDGELVRGVYPGEPIMASRRAGGSGMGSENR